MTLRHLYGNMERAKRDFEACVDRCETQAQADAWNAANGAWCDANAALRAYFAAKRTRAIAKLA